MDAAVEIRELWQPRLAAPLLFAAASVMDLVLIHLVIGGYAALVTAWLVTYKTHEMPPLRNNTCEMVLFIRINNKTRQYDHINTTYR